MTVRTGIVQGLSNQGAFLSTAAFMCSAFILRAYGPAAAGQTQNKVPRAAAGASEVTV